MNRGSGRKLNREEELYIERKIMNKKFGEERSERCWIHERENLIINSSVVHCSSESDCSIMYCFISHFGASFMILMTQIRD